MGHWFAKLFRRDPSPSAHDQAVWDLKIQRDKLQQYQKQIQHVIEKEIEIARKLLRENKKEKAKLALKKKKYQEQLIKKTDAQLQNIHELITNIEFAKIEQKVLEGLKNGTKALKALQEEMKIEEVEKIMEESREAMAYQEEISRILSESLTVEDEESVKNELKQLEEVMLKEELGSVEIKKDDLKVDKKEEKVQKQEEPEKEEEEIEEEEPEKIPVAV